MFLLRWRFGNRLVVAVTSVLALMAGCGPTRYAFFQPQTNRIERPAPAASGTVDADTLPRPAPLVDPTIASETTREAALPTTRTPSHHSTLASRPARHRNPDSQPNGRFSPLFSPVSVAHVAPQTQRIDRHSTNRKTHRLGLVALGLSIAAYAPLILTGAGALAWVLSLTLPLAAVLLGVASLTTISHNKDRYRGKGWAMAAVLLGTGVLGLALIAVAALSVSRVVWEK